VEEGIGEIFDAIGGNKLGIAGTWVTLVVFFFRNELNHRKLRSDSESSMRTALIARMEKIEEAAAKEREACREETRELRVELAEVNKRFFEFQLAMVRDLQLGVVTTPQPVERQNG
jgi:hypothetical protein